MLGLHFCVSRIFDILIFLLLFLVNYQLRAIEASLTDITGHADAHVLLPISVVAAESIRRAVLLVAGHCKRTVIAFTDEYQPPSHRNIVVVPYHAEQGSNPVRFPRNQACRCTWARRRSSCTARNRRSECPRRRLILRKGKFN